MPVNSSSKTSFPLFEKLATGIRQLPTTIRRTPVTVNLCAIIVVLFIGVRASPDLDTALVRFGYRTAFQIWMGSYWSLLTSNIIHQWYWHVALNLVWLWPLGIAVEEVIGPARMLLFVVASGFVSSAVQIAMFGNTGYGASGIYFALVGFVLVARKRHESLKASVSLQDLLFATLWLVGCFVFASQTIANGGHLGGAVFGASAALPFRWERRLWLARAVPAAVAAMSGIAGLVCPWSAHWWATMGYKVDLRGDYPVAIEAYDISLKLNPDQPWVRENRSRLTTDAGSTTDSTR